MHSIGAATTSQGVSQQGWLNVAAISSSGSVHCSTRQRRKHLILQRHFDLPKLDHTAHSGAKYEGKVPTWRLHEGNIDALRLVSREADNAYQVSAECSILIGPTNGYPPCTRHRGSVHDRMCWTERCSEVTYLITVSPEEHCVRWKRNARYGQIAGFSEARIADSLVVVSCA